MAMRKRVLVPASAQDIQMPTRYQVAAILGCSEWTVQLWHREKRYGFPAGTLLSRKLGYRWTVAEIKAFQKRLRQLRAAGEARP